MTVGVLDGGTIAAGCSIVTEGAMPVELTVQVRTNSSSDDWPAVSRGVTVIRHRPS